jgi:hypothetical protein
MRELCAAMALDFTQTLLGSAKGSNESTRWASDNGHAIRSLVVNGLLL